MAENRTPAGIPIRVSEVENENRKVSHPINPEQIEKHAAHYFNQPHDFVFHELMSDYVHLDLLIFEPTEAFPYYRIMTSGMSDRKMREYPEEADYDVEKYMELMITLPADWKMGQQAWSDEKWYWPIRMLKQIARYPHQYDTRLGYAHTLQIPNGPFDGVIILPTLTVDAAFEKLNVGSEKTIYFYSIWPLFQSEMDYKLNHGLDPLIELINDNDLNEIIDTHRHKMI